MNTRSESCCQHKTNQQGYDRTPQQSGSAAFNPAPFRPTPSSTWQSSGARRFCQPTGATSSRPFGCHLDWHSAAARTAGGSSRAAVGSGGGEQRRLGGSSRVVAAVGGAHGHLLLQGCRSRVPLLSETGVGLGLRFWVQTMASSIFESM